MPEVKDNPAASRFEMASGGGTAFVEYRRASVLHGSADRAH